MKGNRKAGQEKETGDLAGINKEAAGRRLTACDKSKAGSRSEVMREGMVKRESMRDGIFLNRFLLSLSFLVLSSFYHHKNTAT